jgi:NAD(P)-dependent dehydrogenase (short-subunit alcohol dehydrogenase family)
VLDEAVKLIGRNVTGVQGDAANLDDLDRLFETVKREKGKIDILFASAGTGEALPLGEITEKHFDSKNPRECAQSGSDRHANSGAALRRGDDALFRIPGPARQDGTAGGNCDGCAVPGVRRFQLREWRGVIP